MSIAGGHVLNHRTPEECNVLSNTRSDLGDAFIVDHRISETLQTGAVGNRTYRSPAW